MGLEQELEELLEVESFDPPAEFRERALWSDPGIYEEAAADPEAWWIAQAKQLLDWEVEPSEGLDDSNPPFYKWFADGRLNEAVPLARRATAGDVGLQTAEPGSVVGDKPEALLRPEAHRSQKVGKDVRGDLVGRPLPGALSHLDLLDDVARAADNLHVAALGRFEMKPHLTAVAGRRDGEAHVEAKLDAAKHLQEESRDRAPAGRGGREVDRDFRCRRHARPGLR